MERLNRAKTANQRTSFQFGTALAARTTLHPFPASRESSRRSMDWGARVPQRRPSNDLTMRSVEMQRNYWTEPPSHAFGEYQDTYEMLGDGGGESYSNNADYYPGDAAGTAATAWQSAYFTGQQHPGFHGLPVSQPVHFLNPFGKTVTLGSLPATVPSAPRDGSLAPFYRAGRNGCNWRHVTQCTGNLGNHMVYINGGVKSDDCQRFPPEGFAPGSGLGAQAVPAAGLRPQVTPRRPATGQQLSSKALQRARAGSKYWFEDKRPPTSTSWKRTFGSQGSCLGVAGTAISGGF